MLTNAGFDMVSLAAEQERRRRQEMFDAAHERAHAAALINERGALGQNPEVVLPGSEAHVGMEFSYENDADKDRREIKRIREARAYGALQPRQIVDCGDHVEYVFDGEHPIRAMAEKLFCIRCLQAQPDNMEDAKRLHRRLRESVPYNYEIPDGLSPMDACCYCGAILGGRNKVA